jgi:hypothetical protein
VCVFVYFTLRRWESVAAVNRQLYCGWYQSRCSAGDTRTVQGQEAGNASLPDSPPEAAAGRRLRLLQHTSSGSSGLSQRSSEALAGAGRKATLKASWSGGISSSSQARAGGGAARRLQQQSQTAERAPVGEQAKALPEQLSSALYDWQSSSGQRLDLAVWVNNSDARVRRAWDDIDVLVCARGLAVGGSDCA